MTNATSEALQRLRGKIKDLKAKKSMILYTDLEQPIHEAAAAGASFEDCKELAGDYLKDSSIAKLIEEGCDPEVLARNERKLDDEIERINARSDKRRRKREAPGDAKPDHVWRRITEDDPSLYGSQYLGREGEMAWMPNQLIGKLPQVHTDYAATTGKPEVNIYTDPGAPDIRIFVDGKLVYPIKD